MTDEMGANHVLRTGLVTDPGSGLARVHRGPERDWGMTLGRILTNE